jgi:hypothetical protein
MNFRKSLKAVHLASTIWFMLCIGYVFILTMLQAGFNWLVIFSLSGYLAFLMMLLVSIYLFSIFRGAGLGPDTQKEHPLTSTSYYMAFYVATPFLGAVAGLLGMMGETKVNVLLGGIALGTIGATFLTWIVVDCIAGSVEMLTPAARKHRLQQLADVKLRKQQEQTNRKQLLARIAEQENENNQLWRQTLAPQAARLANLLTCNGSSFSSAQQEAIGIGVQAWQTGELSCMKQLRDMAMKVFSQQYEERQLVDYISMWWDGVGTWRNPSVVSG